MWAQVVDGVVYVAECTADTCLDPLADQGERPADVYRSADDGDTWTAVSADSASLGVADAWSQGPEAVSPGDADDGRFEVGGTSIDLSVLDPRGRPADGHPAYGVMSFVQAAPDDEIVLRWYARVTEGQSPVPYLSWFDADGQARWTVSATFAGVPQEDGVLLVTQAYRAEEIPDLFDGPFAAWLPSVVDLRDGTLRPIVEPFLNDPHNRNAVVGIRYLD